MKYNTISTSGLSNEGKKSTLTIYTDPNFARDKMTSNDAEIATIRGELEIVQHALKLQTQRCRQLVAEYTKKLQVKERDYHSEKRLRDDQLAKVLRALLMFEARLRQEQKFISHQLEEKDYIIKKQRSDIQKLLSSHYCKNCNQYYSHSSNLESLDSSSEYVVTDSHDYQSSNFESLDSSSETYASVSEKNCGPQKSFAAESETVPNETAHDLEHVKTVYLRNKSSKDSLGRKTKKIVHRKSVGDYFEVLKLRNDNNNSVSSAEENSNDYENIDLVSNEAGKVEGINDHQQNVNKSEMLERKIADKDVNSEEDSCETKVNVRINEELEEEKIENCFSQANSHTAKNPRVNRGTKISDVIPVFEGDDNTNDNWYASASDQEDDDQRDVYRNNPVLECMNQILLQNINDPMNSPPKSPSMDKKLNKSNKRVKFIDEDAKTQSENQLIPEDIESNYYETPIQKTPNFYETPQSIYSNDYEQILSQCNDTFQSDVKDLKPQKEKEFNNSSMKKLCVTKNIDFENSDSKNNHYYVDMDTKSEKDEKENKIIRKSKIMRTPPALPPKPTNLVSKYKIQNTIYKCNRDKMSEKSFDSEPDYCSISEINLPTDKNISFKKISVVAEINVTDSDHLKQNAQDKLSKKESPYIPLSPNDTIPNLVIKKDVEKLNIQVAKQTPIKADVTPVKRPIEPEIPKLPQVTEIIIPDEVENKQNDHISHDNYVKNNTQILKQKSNAERRRPPVVIGSSVSSLIAGFNNKQILSEISHKPDRAKTRKRMFSSFESLQNLAKHTYPRQVENSVEIFNHDKFDLSQNFEEFKLDDCEIEEDYNRSSPELTPTNINNECPRTYEAKSPVNFREVTHFNSPTRVELVRAINDISQSPQLNVLSVQQLKKKLELEKIRLAVNSDSKNNVPPSRPNEPTYEHFLECTGLSSKSILTPTRLISNHKSMLKPKDVKLRSKVKSNLFERQGSTIKYWSEPFL